MTPKRRAALQWLHDRGEVAWFPSFSLYAPTFQMLDRLIKDGLVEKRPNTKPAGLVYYRLTDAGRQALHEGVNPRKGE